MSKNLRKDLPLHFVLLTLAFLTFYPLLFTMFTAFKSTPQFYENFWLPSLPIHPENFIDAWKAISPYIVNTVIIAIVSVSISLVIASISAYAFARFEFKGKDMLFMLILALLMIPNLLTLIPLFLQIKAFGLFDTYIALILPYIAGAQAFTIFVIRNFIESQPKELFEAARVDGGSEWQIFSRIAIPLAMPIVGTMAIMNLLNIWNDYLWPMIAISTPEKWTISVGLLNFQGTYTFQMQYGPMFAGYVIASAPLVILFMFTMNYFIEGLTSGAIKM